MRPIEVALWLASLNGFTFTVDDDDCLIIHGPVSHFQHWKLFKLLSAFPHHDIVEAVRDAEQRGGTIH